MAEQSSMLEALTRKYYQQLSATKRPASSNSNVSLYQLSQMAPKQDPNSFANRVEGAVGEHSTLGKIIDVISRPLYGIAEQAEETAGATVDLVQGTQKSNFGKAIARGDNPLSAAFNTRVGSLASGLSGRSKSLPSDMFKNYTPANGVEGVAKFGVGLGLDIAFDPLTYVPGGVIASGLRKLPKVGKAAESLRAGGMLPKQALEAADEIPEAAAKVDPIKTPEPVKTPEPEAPTFDFGKIPKAPQQSIRQIADAPMTKDQYVYKGTKDIVPDDDLERVIAENAFDILPAKRVYDFKRLPNLYSVQRKAAPAKKNDKPGDIVTWLKENYKQPVTRDSSHALRFSDDPEAVTLGELYSSVVGKNTTSATKIELSRITRLYEAATKSARTGTPQTTPDPSDLATMAGRRAQTGSRSGRIRDAQRAKNLAYLKDKLAPEDYIYLARARSEATFKARRQEILSRVHSPLEASFITDAPKDSPLRALLGEPAKPEAGPRQVLNASSPIAGRAVNKVMRSQMLPEGYKYRSAAKDVARTNVKVGKGLGKADRGFNKRAQYDLWKAIIGPVSAAIKGTDLEGINRARVIFPKVLSEIDEAEAVLRSRGIEPILGSGHSGLPLSFGDLLHALNTNDAGLKAAYTHLFDIKNQSTAAHTGLLDAVEEILDEMRRFGVRSPKDVDEFYRSFSAGRNVEGDLYDRIGRIIAEDPRGTFSRTKDAAARAKSANAPEVRKGMTKRDVSRPWNKETKRGDWQQKDVNTGGKEFSDAVNAVRRGLFNQQTLKELVRRSAANSERFNAQLGYEVQRLSDDVIEEFFKTWSRPTTSTGEKIAAYQSLSKAVDAAGDTINASDNARATAKDIVQDEVDDIIGDDLPIMQSIDELNRAHTPGAIKTAGQHMHDDLAAEAIEEMPVSMAANADDATEAVLDHAIVRAMFPFLSSSPTNLIGRSATGLDHILTKFIPAAGHATLRPALTEGGSVARNLANGWRDQLTQVHKAIPDKTRLAPIFVQMQRGQRIVGDYSPAEMQAIEKLQHLVSAMFEPNAERGLNEAMGSAIFRNGGDVEHINARLAQTKMPEAFRFDLEGAETLAGQLKVDVKDALASQWRDWKVDDPIDFMARMQKVALGVHTDMAISREAFRIAKSMNLASKSKRPGFVKIEDPTGKSVMARYLPEGHYFHKDIVEEFKAMDKVFQESLMFDSPFGRWVNTYMDPFLNMWKAGMTIYRPGHHLRNLIGDSSLSFIADGLPKVHQSRNAMKIMGMRDNYDDFSALRALQGLGPDAGKVSEATLRRGSEIVAHATLKGGRKTTLTAKQVHDYARSRGMLPDFVSGEDLIQSADRSSDTTRAIQESLSLAGGNVRRAAGRVSEARDDYVRLSHFLQIVEKNTNKFDSIDDLMEFAVQRVRKWHPDGTDLSGFESKVMRRIFPFYSWTRKSIPLVVEAMVLNPGRIMMWPKAMYNAAAAAGVDPDSLADPFPKDQLFPSFLTDEMTGPQFDTADGYVGINPGIAHADVMNQFIGDPKAAILGMLTPFIKAPAEMISGNRLDTGSAIHDDSEYLGSNIPGIAHAQSLTGTDILGTLLGGQGHEQIHTVERGNRGQFDRNTLINMLTGLGIQNMSKPSYINYAEIEARDKARGPSRW